MFPRSRGRYPVAARVGVGSGTAAEEAAEAVALRRRGLVAHHSYALLQAAKAPRRLRNEWLNDFTQGARAPIYFWQLCQNDYFSKNSTDIVLEIT